jgi:hypothetical protein
MLSHLQNNVTNDDIGPSSDLLLKLKPRLGLSCYSFFFNEKIKPFSFNGVTI